MSIEERREYQRFNINSEALAILKPHPIKLGQIINISEGGLAFEYIGEEKIDASYAELDVFVSKTGKQFSAIPFKKINDRKVSNDFEEKTPIRQLCVQFRELSLEQKSLLKSFIEKYAA